MQVAKKAVTAAGYICREEQSPEILNLLVDAMLETATVKSDVLPFAAGEALCFAFGGVLRSPDTFLSASQLLDCVLHCAPYACLNHPTSKVLKYSFTKASKYRLAILKPTCAGVKVGPEQLLHTPVDSLAQAVTQDAERVDKDKMKVCSCPLS